MARSVLIVGFPGMQSLYLVGPSEVFTSSTIYLQRMGRADYIPQPATLSEGMR